MSIDIESVIVVLVVLAAAAFLAWRVVSPFLRNSPASGCHGCSTPCELKTAAKTKPCAVPGTPVSVRLVKAPAVERPR